MTPTVVTSVLRDERRAEPLFFCLAPVRSAGTFVFGLEEADFLSPFLSRLRDSEVVKPLPWEPSSTDKSERGEEGSVYAWVSVRLVLSSDLVDVEAVAEGEGREGTASTETAATAGVGVGSLAAGIETGVTVEVRSSGGRVGD